MVATLTSRWAGRSLRSGPADDQGEESPAGAAGDQLSLFTGTEIGVEGSPTGMPGENLGPTPQTPEWTHRAFDISVASLLFLTLSPAFLVASFIAIITRSRPIFYRQNRIGRDGALFECFKFRSMHVDADETLRAILVDDPESAREWDEGYKLNRDPRVTRVGRVLRRFDLDELPQLLNVLRGDMSIVGPRPVIPAEADRFGIALAEITTVKPGLTGLWQIGGRNSLNQEERVALELEYVRRRSLWGDFTICLRTPPVLIRSNMGR